MAQEAQNFNVAGLTNDLEQELATLDSALLQAGRSVAVIRASVAQFSQLGEAVREMEAAMARAREQLSGSWGTGQATPAQLHPVPEQAPAYPEPSQPEPAQPAPDVPEPDQPYAERSSTIVSDPAMPGAASQPPADELAPEPPLDAAPGAPQATPEAMAEQPVEEAPAEPTPDDGIAAARCLRLGVSSRGGSLDLKAVDGSVNENPSVVDVALLDYDGRHATLKLWINESADPNGVRDALISSLRSRLGDEGEADVSIEFEEESAA